MTYNTHITFIAIHDYFSSSFITKGTIFVTGRLYIPFGVCTVTTRTLPSGPGCTSLYSRQYPLHGCNLFSPQANNITYLLRFGDGVFHLENFWS